MSKCTLWSVGPEFGKEAIEWFNSPQIFNRLEGKMPLNAIEIEEFFKQFDKVFGVVDEDDRYIGYFAVRDFNTLHRTAEIDYYITNGNDEVHKKAVELGCEFLQLNGIRRIQMPIDENLEHERKILKSAGFVSEGQLADYKFINGEYRMYYMMRLKL